MNLAKGRKLLLERIAPEEAFRATQQYFPSQFGESESIDLGMSPLMYGGINQFGGG